MVLNLILDARVSLLVDTIISLEKWCIYPDLPTKMIRYGSGTLVKRYEGRPLGPGMYMF